MADNSMSLLPGRNPSGAGGTAIPGSEIGSTSGINPVLPTNNLPGGAPAANPFDPSSVIPSFGANTGAYSSTNLAAPGAGGTFGTPGSTIAPSSIVGGYANLSASEQNSILRELSKKYGSGIGGALASFLSGGAGFSQDAINNLFASLQPGINSGLNQLEQQFSTSGNRFGSGAQIGTADYLSQVNLNEGQLETQMYEQSVQNYMNTLLNVGDTTAKLNAAAPSTADTLSGILGTVGAGADGITAGLGAASGGAGAIGSILAGLAAI